MVANHNCEIVVLAFKKNPKKNNFWTYSPKDSLGDAFLKSKHGPLVLDSFRIFMEKNLKCMFCYSFLSEYFHKPLSSD